MKWLPFLLLVVIIASCNSSAKKEADQTVPPPDSLTAVMDSTTGIVNYNHKEDSARRKLERDSFYSIPVIRKFTGKDDNDAVNQVIASMIDTTGVTKTPVKFTGEWNRDYAKDSSPVNRYSVFTNASWKIKVTIDDKEDTRRIFINNRELKPGRDLDTTLADDWWITSFEIEEDGFYSMKFGNKNYLLITGYVHMCNGTGCGISYYLLYDPSNHKAMLLQQLRSEFITGYDSKTKSPLFIDNESKGYDWDLKVFRCAGKAYRFNASGKIQKYTDGRGKQYFYNGYGSDADTTLRIFEGNFAR
jgi:hypothetical protein